MSGILDQYGDSAIEDWLTGQRPSLSPLGRYADQDVFLSFAEERSADELIALFQSLGIDHNAKLHIACAICSRVEWLHDIADLPGRVTDDNDRLRQIATLLHFVNDRRELFASLEDDDGVGYADLLPRLDAARGQSGG